MIITAQKPFPDILKGLRGAKRVFIVGCGECATTCKTGGEEEVAFLKAALEGEGLTVTGCCVPSAPCVAAKVKTETAKNMKALRESQAVVVLSCGLGVQSVRDNDRLGLLVLPGCDTLCGAVVDAQGDFMEKCSLCGACVLGETGGICPVTLCAKGLLHGPCGGMNKGKCEVNEERDCAWVLIYNEKEKQKRLGEMKGAKAPRDYKKATRPHKILMVK